MHFLVPTRCKLSRRVSVGRWPIGEIKSVVILAKRLRVTNGKDDSSARKTHHHVRDGFDGSVECRVEVIGNTNAVFFAMGRIGGTAVCDEEEASRGRYDLCIMWDPGKERDGQSGDGWGQRGDRTLGFCVYGVFVNIAAFGTSARYD